MLQNQNGGSRRNQAPEVVKSAVRVLDILDFFDRHKDAASVGQVSAGLGFPQSSTSALLRSLMKVGYLHYDPCARTFRPTARVAMLGGWCASPFFSDGPVLQIARGLADQTGMTVGIARRSNRGVQWLYTFNDDDQAAEWVDASPFGLLNSAVGVALLSASTESDMRGLTHRFNAEKAEDLPSIFSADLIARANMVRRDGYCIATDEPSVSMLVPSHLAGEPIAICVSGSGQAGAFDSEAIVAAMRGEMDKHAAARDSARVIPFETGHSLRRTPIVDDDRLRYYAS